MVIFDENNPNLTTAQGGQEGIGRRKSVQKRRALRVISSNLVGAHRYPCVVNKRGLPQKDETFIGNNSVPADSFARSLKQEQCQEDNKKLRPSISGCTNERFGEEDNKKLRPSVSGTNEQFCDRIFVDSETQPPCDHPVPMSLEKPNSRPDLHQMDEVEMEDIIIEDIDGSDADNPLAVTDYVEDLHAYYREKEGLSCVPPDYMVRQYDINEKMRAILIDWLIEVHDKFELMSETLFLTVNLIDRFLSKRLVERKKLQLVGLVAMLVACKYEEVSVPMVGDLVIISDRAYTRKDVLAMEKLMLNTLQFDMSLPTPYVFLKRFLKAAKADKKVEMTAFFLIELAMVEYGMLRFPPSLLAASAVYTAQSTRHCLRQWSRTCEWYTNYSEQQLLECSRMMVGFHEKAATGRLTAAHRKYCTSKFGYTAKCKPAYFLLGPDA